MRCPDDEKFAQYAEGSLVGDERSQFLLHLGECSKCSILYAMAYGHMNESACSDEESLSRLAEGKLSQRQREALLKHIARCKACSAEFYLLRKPQSAKTAMRNQRKWKNKYQLVAIAAIITLLIGFTGVNMLEDDGFTGGENLSVIYRDAEIYDSISATTPAPLLETAQDTAIEAERQFGGAMKKSARIAVPAAPPEFAQNIAFEAMKTQAALKMEQTLSDDLLSEEDEAIYEVIYNGHDGDVSEIVKLIQMIAGKDEKDAEITAEGSSEIIKECSSMDEAQRIKKELEEAGAKIIIQRR